MTPDEARSCTHRLAATFGGEWDEDKVVVWAEVLLPMDYAAAVAAIRAMSETERFLSIAAFREASKPTLTPRPYVPELPEAKPDRDTVVSYLDEARRKLRKDPA